MVTIICNILAVISLIAFCASNFFKTKRGILGGQLICGIVEIVMYYLSRGMTGLASATATTLRNLAFVRFKNNIAVILFSMLKILLLIFSYENIISFVFIIF